MKILNDLFSIIYLYFQYYHTIFNFNLVISHQQIILYHYISNIIRTLF